MRGRKIHMGLALAACMAACTLSAKELYGPEAGVVPYGMGRAYSAIADDWLALYYNPAGLALVRRVDFQILNLQLGGNRDVLDSYKNIKDLSKQSNSTASTLNQYAGKHVQGELSNFTQITLPNFALGLNYQVHANVDMQNTAYPQTEMRYTKDLSFLTGFAVGIGPKKPLRLGMRMEYINRRGSKKNILIENIAGSKKTLLDFFESNGSGFAGAAGMQYTLPLRSRTEVTTSFVWHDIGKTSFGSYTDRDRPFRKDDNMVVGLGVRLPIGGRKNRRLERRYGPDRSSNHLSFAVDYSHLNYSLDEEHLPKHLHLGMNLDLPIVSVQLGMNQTSLTMGASFDIGVLSVSAATYGEELGSYGGQRRDRRYVLSVGSGFGFKGF